MWCVGRCSIFHASSLGTGGDAVKLPLVLRDQPPGDGVQPTLIFDYKSWFLPALNHYALNGGPAPDPRVFLLIGTQKRLSDIDESVPIYATIACQRAIHDLTNISNILQVHHSIVISMSVCLFVCLFVCLSGVLARSPTSS